MLTENFNISVKEMATIKIPIPGVLGRTAQTRHSIKNGLKSITAVPQLIRAKVFSTEDVRWGGVTSQSPPHYSDFSSFRSNGRSSPVKGVIESLLEYLQTMLKCSRSILVLQF